MNLVGENKVAMTMITSKFTLDKIHDFQEKFMKQKIGQKPFLQSDKNHPTYDEKIE